MNCNDSWPSGGGTGGATTPSAPSSLLHFSVTPAPENYLALFSSCLNHSGYHLEHLHSLYFLWHSFMHIKLVQQTYYCYQSHPLDTSISFWKFGDAFISQNQDVPFALLLEFHPGHFTIFLLRLEGSNNPSYLRFPNGELLLTLKCGVFLHSSVHCNNVLFSGSPSKTIMGPSEKAILAPQVKFSVSIPVSPSPAPLQCVFDEAPQALPRSGHAFLDVIPGYPTDTTWMWTPFCLQWLIVPSTQAPTSHLPTSHSLSSLQPRPLPLHPYGYSNHCLWGELDGINQLIGFFTSASPKVRIHFLVFPSIHLFYFWVQVCFHFRMGRIHSAVASSIVSYAEWLPSL